MFKKIWIAIVNVNFLLYSVFGQNIGESCSMKNGRVSGVCTHISECSQNQFEATDSFIYTKCDSDDFLIICCPTKFSSVNSISDRFENTRISEQKCKEYSAAIYVNSVFLPLSVGAPSIITKKEQCAHKIQPLVVGGEEARLHEFPHMALLGYVESNNKVSWDCGGSLISDQFVLTAAHCIRSDLKIVRLGELNYESTEDGAEPIDFGISKTFVHPKYDNPPDSSYNDIGILKLSGKVKLTPGVRPACLPTSAELSERSIATGWGQTLFAGSPSSHLLKTVLEKFTKKECKAVFKAGSINLPNGIDDSQFCVGHRTEIKDTCNGDSGGPLQNYHSSLKCMYTLYGITSTGQGCGIIGVPGLYIQIWNYIDWIENIVWS